VLNPFAWLFGTGTTTVAPLAAADAIVPGGSEATDEPALNALGQAPAGPVDGATAKGSPRRVLTR